MFEDKTYENILADMLSRVPSDIDRREGSIIYDALAPAAYELSQVYFKLDNYIDLFFLDTTIGEYLDRKAADFGITRKPATYSVRKIETTGAIDIGSRWGINDATYIITELLSVNIYSATCEQSGEIGNAYSGALQSTENTSGVTAALTDILIIGTEEEDDEGLRDRTKQYLTNPAQDGNTAQYLKWAMEYPGIGTAKVFPLWNGGNTVKIAITNSRYVPAESILVEEFQEYMDPNAEGLGNGVAPVGSKVTITGGTQLDINITGDVVLSEGYTEAEGAADTIANYLASMTYDKKVSSVSYMRIGNALMDCPSIADLSNLTLNSGTSNVLLTGDQIPVLTSLTLTVVTS